MKNKSLKIAAFLLLCYPLVVVLFESSLGYFQPETVGTLQITTLGSDGSSNTRILARIESGGTLYVAANHWPRAWYRQALANPAVQIVSSNEQGDYLAVSVQDVEHERVDVDNALGLTFRILTGFPPRYFLRLDPAN